MTWDKHVIDTKPLIAAAKKLIESGDSSVELTRVKFKKINDTVIYLLTLFDFIDFVKEKGIGNIESSVTVYRQQIG